MIDVPSIEAKAYQLAQHRGAGNRERGRRGRGPAPEKKLVIEVATLDAAVVATVAGGGAAVLTMHGESQADDNRLTLDVRSKR
jgi:hypothetical protein